MRNSVAIVLGIVIGMISVKLFQMIPNSLYTGPETDVVDIEWMKAYVASLPPLAFGLILVSHALGAFVAATVATLIGRSIRWLLTFVVGGFFTLMIVSVLATVPHPTWFVIFDVVISLPFAFLGEWLGRTIKGDSMFKGKQAVHKEEAV